VRSLYHRRGRCRTAHDACLSGKGNPTSRGRDPSVGQHQQRLDIQEMWRRAKTGIFTTSSTNPNAIAAANSEATTAIDSGAMAIP